MGLVYRDGRPYLYRSVRRAGRVTSEYVASGIDAQPIAALEADDRDNRRCDLEKVRAERRELDALERALDEIAERARDRARDALTAAGYHQHHRCEWRKRRVSRHREGETGRSDDGRLGGCRVDRLGRGEDSEREDEGETQG
jgi:hypothetical protein